MAFTFTEDVIRTLKDAGCCEINFGVQTSNETVRRNVLKRFESNELLLNTSKLLNKYKISLIVDHIFALPGETDEDCEDALLMYNKMRPKIINSFFLRYFPGTEIIKEGIDKNKITYSDVEKIENGEVKDYVDAGDRGENKYMKYRLVFGLIPILPESVIDFIIRKKIYRFISTNTFLSFIIPRFIASLFWKSDVRAKRYIMTYLTVKNYFN